MLIDFTVSNWMCFKAETSLSMLASREQKHKEHLAIIPRHKGEKILPVAAVFGANASGKSKLIEAIAFAKSLITDASKMDELIQVRPFGFDSESFKAPSSFSFIILVNETMYRYEFSVLADRVVSEQLTEILATKEKVLFQRHGAWEGDDREDFLLAPGFAEEARLRMAFDGTRRNQLFLNNSVYQRMDTFRPVFDWFKNTLEIIVPSSKFVPVEQFFAPNSPLQQRLPTALEDLDTGIVNLELQEEPFSPAMLGPAERQNLENNLTEGALVRVRQGKEIVFFSREGGTFKMRSVVTVHRGANGERIPMPLSVESDGTLRLLNLLPAFFTLGDSSSKKVYIIDELDRSLHPTLMEYLVELFLQTVRDTTRSQILFTTHNVLMMSQRIFRRDEMWLVRRNAMGESSLVSLGDFEDIRFDKDVRKSYLEGRLGGIPHISPRMTLEEQVYRAPEDSPPIVAEP